MHTFCNPPFFRLVQAALVVAANALCAPLMAQPKLHPWLVESPRLDASAYFTNLSEGATVQSPFVARFGMSHWGIAPAGLDAPFTGHHHLLIDQALPLDIEAPLPFSERYVHFGKGQMEAVLDLAPGKHTLRLLLADHKHRPHFVFSPALNIQVLPGRSALSANYGKLPALELVGVINKQTLSRPFKLGFHASGLNIAPRASKLVNTGIFRLKFTPSGGGGATEIAFPNGQSEAWFAPPRGSYIVQLLYENNADGRVQSTVSEPITVTVKG